MRACKSKYLSKISRGIRFFCFSPLISVDVPLYSFMISQATSSKIEFYGKGNGQMKTVNFTKQKHQHLTNIRSEFSTEQEKKFRRLIKVKLFR